MSANCGSFCLSFNLLLWTTYVIKHLTDCHQLSNIWLNWNLPQIPSTNDGGVIRSSIWICKRKRYDVWPVIKLNQIKKQWIQSKENMELDKWQSHQIIKKPSRELRNIEVITVIMFTFTLYPQHVESTKCDWICEWYLGNNVYMILKAWLIFINEIVRFTFRDSLLFCAISISFIVCEIDFWTLSIL